MPDLSAAFATPALEEAFLGVVDVEGKLLAALEELGPVGGRDVVLLDAGRGSWERQLAGIGAAVTAVAFPDPLDEVAALARIAELPVAEADTVVVPWSELAVPGSRVHRRSATAPAAVRPPAAGPRLRPRRRLGAVARAPRSSRGLEPAARAVPRRRVPGPGHPLLVDLQVDRTGARAPDRRLRAAGRRAGRSDEAPSTGVPGRGLPPLGAGARARARGAGRGAGRGIGRVQRRLIPSDHEPEFARAAEQVETAGSGAGRCPARGRSAGWRRSARLRSGRLPGHARLAGRASAPGSGRASRPGRSSAARACRARLPGRASALGSGRPSVRGSRPPERGTLPGRSRPGRHRPNSPPRRRR